MNKTVNSNNHIEEQEGYILVNQKQTDFDSEKGFCYYDLVYKRESDGKFFKVEYADYGKGQQDFTSEPKEVQQKTKTIIYYE